MQAVAHGSDLASGFVLSLPCNPGPSPDPVCLSLSWTLLHAHPEPHPIHPANCALYFSSWANLHGEPVSLLHLASLVVGVGQTGQNAQVVGSGGGGGGVQSSSSHTGSGSQKELLLLER